MDILMRRDGRNLALRPATDLDTDQLSRLFQVVPDDYPMLMRGIFARTNKLNGWYRSIVGKAADGVGMHPQSMHIDLKIKAGLVEHVMLSPEHRGVIHVTTRSTAFPEMSDFEFADFVNFAVPCIFRDYVPGIRSAEQRKLIEQWAGRRPKLEEPPKLIGFEAR